MHRCLDPSKLPKAPRLRSINRRHVTPGSPLPLIFPGIGLYDPARAVEPTHPATRWKAHTFPCFSCPAFMLRAVPKSVLLRPEFERWESQKQCSTMVSLKNVKNKRLDMSILFIISKKKTNKRAVVRNRIAMRIRAAFELIVARGADAELREVVEGGAEECVLEELTSSSVTRKPRKKQKSSAHQLRLASLVSSAVPSNLRLVSNPEPTDHLILQDWTYVMSPSLLTYRMPLPNLIKHLRAGLENIRAQAMKLDALWVLNKKPTIIVPLAGTKAEHAANWREIAANEDELPTLFDFDEPEQESNKSTKPQKRRLKLFFPTQPPSRDVGSDDSSVASDSMVAAQPDGSSTRSVPSVPSTNGPSRQSLGFISEFPKNIRPHPAPSKARSGAMDRLADMMNRPLVIPGGKQDRRRPS